MSAAPKTTATRAPGAAGADVPGGAHQAARASVGADAARSAGQAARWLAFAVVIAAAVMDLLDSTIAQVAAPTIRRDCDGSYAVISG